MKRKLIYPVIALSLAVSCERPELGTDVPDRFSVIALPPALSGQTKASIGADSFSWSDDDALSVVVANRSSAYRFVRTAIRNQFVNDDYKPEDGTNEYYIVYPYSEAISGAEDGFVTGPIAVGTGIQKQDGSGNTSHLSPVFYGKVSVEGKGNAYTEMAKATAEMRIVFQNQIQDNLAVNKVTMRAPAVLSGNFNIGGESTPELRPSGETSGTVSLEVENVTVPLMESASFYLTCAPFSLKGGEKLSLEMETSDGVKTFEITAPEGGLAYSSEGINQINVGSEGSGTQNDPYILSTPSSLLAMSKFINVAGETYFKLGADIDLSSVTDWKPLNNSESAIIHFDGNGKTISNFTCATQSDPSFFGVFAGTCKDVTFDNAKLSVVSGDAGSVGILCAYVPVSQSRTVFSGVTLKGSIDASDIAVDDYKVGQVGGLAGKVSGELSIESCSVDIDIKGAGTAGKDPETSGMPKVTKKDQNVGGLIGLVDNTPVTVSETSVKGTIFVYGEVVAGMIAKVEKNQTIAIHQSYNEANVYAGSNTAGLLAVANDSQVEITDCHNSGKISSVLDWGDASICGIASRVSGLTMARTYNDGFISCRQSTSSGLVGTVWGTALVENCYAVFPAGNEPSGWDTIGGIIASAKGSATVRNCYAAGNTFEARAHTIGGIVGRADQAVTMENCVVSFTEIHKNMEGGVNPNAGSGGALIGYVASPAQATLTNCWRNADMKLISKQGYLWKPPYDQENASPSSPITWSYDTTMYAQEDHKPYHGKAMSDGQKLSDKARELNWDTSVWDLGGDLPKLK